MSDTYTVVITDTETGAKVETEHRWPFAHEYTDDALWRLEWYWTEGNFGCDCNRELAFRRALGEDPDIDSVTCGEGRYRITSAPWMGGQGGDMRHVSLSEGEA